MWTKFWDMHSGGDQKLDWPTIYIEAPKEEAKIIFYNVFGRNPEWVTCTGCGEDYVIEEYETLEMATAFHRGCRFDKAADKYVDEPSDYEWSSSYRTLKEYIDSGEVKVLKIS